MKVVQLPLSQKRNQPPSRSQIKSWKHLVVSASLDEVRKILDADADNENKKAQKAHAVALLAEFASRKDSERIKKILEREYAVIAAESLLKRRIRKKTNEKSNR